MRIVFNANLSKFDKAKDSQWEKIRIATYSINIRLAKQTLEQVTAKTVVLVSKECFVPAIHLAESLLNPLVEIHVHPETHIKMLLLQGADHYEAHLSSSNWVDTDWAEFDIHTTDREKIKKCIAYFDCLISSPLSYRLFKGAKLS